MHAERAGGVATLLSSGKVLVAGGAPPDGVVDTAEEFDPATGEFTLVGDLEVAGNTGSATLLKNGKGADGGWRRHSIRGSLGRR